MQQFTSSLSVSQPINRDTYHFSLRICPTEKPCLLVEFEIEASKVLHFMESDNEHKGYYLLGDLDNLLEGIDDYD